MKDVETACDTVDLNRTIVECKWIFLSIQYILAQKFE